MATVKWTADQMLRRLLPQGVPEFTDPSGRVVLAEVPVNPAWVGHRVSDLEVASGGTSRTSPGSAPACSLVPTPCTRRGDLVHIATLADELARVERTLDAVPQRTDA